MITKSLIWSGPVNFCESVGLLLSVRFRLFYFEDKGQQQSWQV